MKISEDELDKWTKDYLDVNCITKIEKEIFRIYLSEESLKEFDVKSIV